MAFKPVIPAKNIRRIAHGDGQIEEFVNEILGIVNDKIEDAIEQGQESVFLELRTTFDIPRMKNSDIQRPVYYWVLKSLSDADYKVSIDFRGVRAEEQKVFLFIKWLKRQDETLKKYMDGYIKKRTIKDRRHHHHPAEERPKKIFIKKQRPERE